MKLTFLGTGTSHGVPVIACDCRICKSTNPKNKRNRCSAYIETNKGKAILLDIGPEFRIQAIQNNIKKVDALLLTHSHADHLHGIDDLRIFSVMMDHKPETESGIKKFMAPPIPIYTNPHTAEDIKHRFSYFFMPSNGGGGHAKVELKAVSENFQIDDITVTPIPMIHGKVQTTGYVLTEKAADGTLHSIAYLTDCNFISEEAFDLIKKNCHQLDHLIIDGLRIKEHSTHFSFLQAMEAASKLNADKVWFTHLTHDHDHQEVVDYINSNRNRFPGLKAKSSILPAYDGLVVYTK